MPSVKSQQFRWTKGPAEVARKNLPNLLLSSQSILTKTLGFTHLLNSTIFIFVLTSGLASLGMVTVRAFGYHAFLPEQLTLVSSASLASLIIFYSLSQIKKTKRRTGSEVIKSILDFPLFICLCLGFSFHNSLAVIEGLTGIKSSFIRTPKFGIMGNSGKWKTNAYNLQKIPWGTWIEGFIAILFLLGIVFEISTGQWINSIYHILLFIGFSMVFSLSVIHSFARE